MNLAFSPISEKNQALLAPAVYQCVKDLKAEATVQVAAINPAFADGESLSREYGISYEMEVNCLVVEGSRGDEKRYAALLVPYGKRAKTNATVKKPLDASKVGFADLSFVVEKTGMEYGSITPLGLPSDWLILIDASLLEQEKLVLGGGLVSSKICLPSAFLTQLPNAQVIEELAKD